MVLMKNGEEEIAGSRDKEIVMVRGRKPFICKKFDYSQHLEADKLKDMTLEEQREIFKESIEQNSKKLKPEKKIKYSFKDF